MKMNNTRVQQQEDIDIGYQVGKEQMEKNGYDFAYGSYILYVSHGNQSPYFLIGFDKALKETRKA